jgi:hypothetical protein
MLLDLAVSAPCNRDDLFRPCRVVRAPHRNSLPRRLATGQTAFEANRENRCYESSPRYLPPSITNFVRQA